MELKKIYNATNNPLKDKQIVDQILKIYSDSLDKLDFVTKLRDTESDFLNAFVFTASEYSNYYREFYKTHFILFNKWMQDIKRISKLPEKDKAKFFEKVSFASHDVGTFMDGDKIMTTDAVKRSFNKIANRVKYTNNITDFKQIERFKEELKKEDKNTERLLEILNYYSNKNIEEEVINIKSNYLLEDGDKYNRNGVFLAFIPDKNDQFNFINEYLTRCIKCKIPYEIDVSVDKHTKQIVKISSTTANLGKNLAIIKDIADSKPDMIKGMKKPPILCGTIQDNEWIGIGTYSAKEIERTTFGFTERRGNIIFDTIQENSIKYLKENFTKPIEVDGKETTLREHLSDLTLDILLKSLKNMADSWFDGIKDGGISDKEADREVKKVFGFKRQDLDNQKYIKKIKDEVDYKIDAMVYQEFDLQEDFYSFKLPNTLFSFGKTISLPIKADAIKDEASEVLFKQPDFIEETINEIESKFEEVGIDTNPCYEDYIVDRMEELDREERQQANKTVPLTSQLKKQSIYKGNRSKDR